MSKTLFLSPHNDDETLFGAYTIQRERAHVVIIYDSHVQPSRSHVMTMDECRACNAENRRQETKDAIRYLNPTTLRFCGVSDLDNRQGTVNDALVDLKVRLALYDIEKVYVPAIEVDGHTQHNLVGEMAAHLWRDREVIQYLTYTRTGGKSRSALPVASTGEMVINKLKAMACYTSQIMIDKLGCREHFTRDLNEYYA